MKAVVFRIPNDNFKNLYAETFQTENEMREYVIGLTDCELVTTIDVEDTRELEDYMISRLDETSPNWELDRIDYYVNKFTAD